MKFLKIINTVVMYTCLLLIIILAGCITDGDYKAEVAIALVLIPTIISLGINYYFEHRREWI